MSTHQPSLFDTPEPAPYVAHSSTSKAAAVAIAPKIGKLQAKVLAAIQKARGLTDEEGIAVTGIAASSYRPRRRELEQAGLVRDSGAKRKTASGRDAVIWETAR